MPWVLAPRTDQQRQRDRADAQLLDHAASYLRERLSHGHYAGMSGIYAGYTMCGLLDNLAVELRGGGLPAQIRAAAVSVARDLAREEFSHPAARRLTPGG